MKPACARHEANAQPDMSMKMMPQRRSDVVSLPPTASHCTQTEVVQSLLAHKANVKAAAMDDMLPLHFAAQKGHTEVCRHLINGGTRRRNTSAMCQSAYPVCSSGVMLRSCKSVSHRLCCGRAGTPVNAKTRKGINALHYAIQNGEPPPPSHPSHLCRCCTVVAV